MSTQFWYCPGARHPRTGGVNGLVGGRIAARTHSVVSCAFIMRLAAQENSNARAMAALRIGVGVFFLIFGEYKVFGTQFTLGGGFQFWISKFLEGGVYPFMEPVLRNFVLPHATAIAFSVAYGEFCIGLGLVLGILVRPASVGGLAFMLVLLFSSDYPGAHAPFWQYFGASLSHSIFALCFVAFLIGRSDEVWSVRKLRTPTKTSAPAGF
jgi:uncharacterized membrane protein YphA (DoxX/SURF4 family)